MAREIEFADDFGAKERDHVRTFGKKKAGDDFFGNRRAAEDVAAFENDDLLACFGEIRGVDQAVVATADDDNVVVLPHSVGLRPFSRTPASVRGEEKIRAIGRVDILLRREFGHKSR